MPKDNVCVVAVALARHEHELKEPRRIELKLVETNEDKDELEQIEKMIEKNSCSLVDKKIPNE